MELQVLDEARAMLFCGGSHEVYRRALVHFVSLYRGGLPELNAFIATPTLKLIDPLRRRLHAISGVASVLGAAALAQSVDAVDAALRTHRAGKETHAAAARLQQDLAATVAAASAASDLLPQSQ